jgi:hypothetical protein
VIGHEPLAVRVIIQRLPDSPLGSVRRLLALIIDMKGTSSGQNSAKSR